MQTSSESPITLSSESLIASQQGTMQFMSIEVATQDFLFCPPPRLSLDELNSALDRDGPDKGTAPANVPFSHNHLHDLESLWWVAVWIDFHYHFSKKETSPSVTLKDAEKQLRLAQTLFPPVRGPRLHSPQWLPNYQVVPGEMSPVAKGHPTLWCQSRSHLPTSYYSLQCRRGKISRVCGLGLLHEWYLWRFQTSFLRSTVQISRFGA
jgi:hypothetical protein